MRSKIFITNSTSADLAIYVEPWPSDYWLKPGERVSLDGDAGSGDIDVIPYDGGVTVWFGEDPDPVVRDAAGSELANGHGRSD